MPLILLLIPALASCYASHDRADRPVHDSTTHDTVHDTTGRCDVGMSPLPPPCTEPPGDRPSSIYTVLSEDGSMLGVTTDGCDMVYVTVHHSSTVIHRSFDEGTAFMGGGSFMGSWAYTLVDDDGTLHTVSVDHEQIRRTARDEWGGTLSADVSYPVFGEPQLIEAEAIVHRVADTRGTDEISLAWKTNDANGIWFATSSSDLPDPPPMLLHEGDEVLPPRMCLGGDSRVVVVWISYEEGAVHAAVSEDHGTSFSTTVIGQGEYDSNVDVECARDGRAVAVWDRGNEIGLDEGIVASALDTCGVWSSPTLVMDEGTGWAHYFYPHVHISGERALVTWAAEHGTTFGYAIVDLEARLVTEPVTDLDISSDGHRDRLLRGCATPTGFMILAQARWTHSVPETTGPAVVARIDPTGTIVDFDEPGPYTETRIDVDMACTRRGRALMVWRDFLVAFASWQP